MAENSTWFATDVATLGDLQRLRAHASGLVDEVALVENNLKALLRWQAA